MSRCYGLEVGVETSVPGELPECSGDFYKSFDGALNRLNRIINGSPKKAYVQPDIDSVEGVCFC